MHIQYASDLHLEFSINRKFLAQNFLKADGDILVLAGDIVPFAKMHLAKSFFKKISNMYEQVYWIAGNHEYYYSDVADRFNPANSFSEKIASNITLLNNTTIELDKVRILFSTFWSSIPDGDIIYLQKGMADFSLIKEDKKLLSCDTYNLWHKNAINYITRELAIPSDKKTIVVTHHVPTFYNYPDEFIYSRISAGFATEYKDFIADSMIDYWIFGHHHRNMNGFYIGKTELLTNQLGYVWHEENKGFQANSTIEIA